MLGIGPGLVFAHGNRWPPWRGTRRERVSVHVTNAGIVGVLLAAHATVGLPVFPLAEVPTLVLGATAGVWRFYVQHQFEDAYWARRPAWEPVKATLEGSSYNKLPIVLQWVTGLEPEERCVRASGLRRARTLLVGLRLQTGRLSLRRLERVEARGRCRRLARRSRARPLASHACRLNSDSADTGVSASIVSSPHQPPEVGPKRSSRNPRDRSPQ